KIKPVLTGKLPPTWLVFTVLEGSIQAARGAVINSLDPAVNPARMDLGQQDCSSGKGACLLHGPDSWSLVPGTHVKDMTDPPPRSVTPLVLGM
ncbi:hypothetical protein LEMLEM_LOCUS7353, partial [Lemmus lemmus]